MDVTFEFKWNSKTKKGLEKVPDEILYTIAKQTLDLSTPQTPMSKIVGHAGTLRRSGIAGGVRGGSGDYYIGSYTNYASRVWKMENVHWTTPGTNNKWYARTLKKHSSTIINNAINKGWKKGMQ